MGTNVTRWHAPHRPDAVALLATLRASGRDYSTWSNGPGDIYAAHVHTFHKHLVCLRGSITFHLTHRGDAIELAAGDELDLAAGTWHSAVVGPHGVACAEAHLPA
jgi:quercetin dioxygenase-like cupin family protein